MGDGYEGAAPVADRRFLTLVIGVGLAGVLGLAATAYVALGTSRGMRLDIEAMNAVSSPEHVLRRFLEALSWVSVASVALSLLACVMLAMVRRRLDLALAAVVLIGGANVTTQVLKYHVFTRPDLTLGPNSLPSGHTTVVLSIAMAALIVAPAAWRSTVAIGATAIATLVGVATVLGRWHRPSDVIAATLVCLAWAAIGLLAVAVVRSRLATPTVSTSTGGTSTGGTSTGSTPTRRVTAHLGTFIGASVVGGLLASWGVRPQPGMRDLGLGILSLGAIGLACAVSVATIAYLVDRYVG